MPRTNAACPFPSAAALCLQVYPPEQLHELLAMADHVVLALPGTKETTHIIDAAALAAMKPSGVLINVGRGNSIDQEALVQGEGPSFPASACSMLACLPARTGS